MERKIKKIAACPECGSMMLTTYNDSNREAWVKCQDCDAETTLEFAEDYDPVQHSWLIERMIDKRWENARWLKN